MLAAKQLISSIVMSLFLLTSYTYAGTMIVNSTADTNARDDVVTLREAIMLSEGTLNSDLLTPDEQAQVSTPVGSGEADTINFGVSGTIIVRFYLPTITDDGTVIDASSQWTGEWPGGQPGVILDGDWNGDAVKIIGANNCHIRGLFITKFMHGISIYDGAKLNTIGGTGTGYRNIISGNDEGIHIFYRGTDSNIVSGNYIGTDATGTADLGNNGTGIVIGEGARLNIIGGTTADERNVVSGNNIFGISIGRGTGTDNNSVIGNYIGTDATGTAALGNSDDGILIVDGAQFNTIGGTTPEERNIMSGNGRAGILIAESHNNVVSGNYIGTDVTGTVDLGNSYGAWIKGSSSNTIGGTTVGERNIISGNDGHGIKIEGVPSSESETANNIVLGNYIGTDASGTEDLGNLYSGICIVTGAQSNTIGGDGVGNTIAFNYEDGIFIEGGGTDLNEIFGNSIHDNGSNGIHIRPGSHLSMVGAVSTGNTIAFNGENGILIEGGGSDFNTISGNSIHDNAELGIELIWGGNDEIEPPNVTWVGLADGILTISGDAAGADAAVEIFEADSSGQEGQIFLGSLIADGSGEFSDPLSVAGKDLSVGERIVTTTTHTDGNTSEFSSPLTVSEEQESPVTGPVLNPVNGHYYEVVIEQVNWDDAKVAAESRTLNGLQGHLATITSQDENDFIAGLLPFGAGYWIGGFQPPGSPEPDGNWQWTTGESFDYTNWGAEEPNETGYGGENEDRLEFDGEWNDLRGSHISPGYVVEYEPEARRLSITSAEASPGTPTVAQLSIDDATGVASGDIIIKYDASVITVDEVTPTELLSDILLVPNIEVPGEIGLYMAGTTGLSEGSGALVEIALTVNADAEVGTETVLSFGEVRIYDEQGMVIPVNLEEGVVKITRPGIKGDVNDDGEVRSNDAMMALRIAAGLMIPTEYQQWAADMNDDGEVKANDAISILRKAAGLAAPGRGMIANAGGRITVTLSEAHGVAGERVTVPIEVDNVDMLASGEICIAYDSAVLRAVHVLSAPDVLLASNTTERGMLRIAFASANRLNSQTVAEIQFDVLADAVSTLRFRTVELYGPDANAVNSIGVDKEFRPWAVHPKHNALLQNFPNPFNPETWIPYQLAEDSEVTVRIYSATGQLVRAMHLGYREAGSYVTRDKAAYWDGRNEAGEQVSSGIYFYSIAAGDFSATKKMTIGK